MQAKKTVGSLTVLFMIASLAACVGYSVASAAEAQFKVDPSGKTEPYDVVLATGGSAGAYYVMGATFSQIGKNYGSRLKFTVSNTGASTENIYLMEDKVVNFAVVQADAPYFAQLGQREFEGETPFKALRSVYGGHSSITHMAVRADKGINRVEDLRGKVIATSPSGSPTVTFHRAYLAAFGLEPGSYTETFMTYGEMAEALINDTADAVMIFNTTPNSPIIEAASSTPLKILGLTQKQQDDIVAKYPYIARCTIPASAYEWLDEDVITIGALAMIITTADVPNDVVYDLCALIGDHYPEVKAGHSSGYLWDPETAHESLGIELHEGAKQYFKDRGIIK